MGIGASSRTNKKKLDEDNITFCIICYENDIKPQRLVCGHAFCYDCILSIYEYEDVPRCPLCRQYICVRVQINETLDADFSWFKIGRKIANFLAIAVSCCIFCYNILPTIRAHFQDWDFTQLHGLLNDVRIEYGRVKGIWF